MELEHIFLETTDEPTSETTTPKTTSGETASLDLLGNITVELSIELGTKKMSIQDILQLTKNSVIKLDKPIGEALDIRANGNLIARGEIVTTTNGYGIRLTQIIAKSKSQDLL